MKVEYKYTAQPENEEAPSRHRTVAVYYFYCGESVLPGRYVCTFCGYDTKVHATKALPPCHECDSSEFAWDEAA